MLHHTIRDRAPDRRGRAMFVVEDPDGRACLNCGGQLQLCLAADGAGKPCWRLATLLARRATWTAVSPPVACTGEGLRRLAGTAAGRPASQ